VERLAGVEAPPRAQAIRVLAAELERIHSHLLWVGVAAHEAGFETLFMYTWRDREVVMDTLEALSGNRVNYSVNLLGGVKYDVTAELAEQILNGIAFIEERTLHYMEVIASDALFVARTRGIGVTTKEQAERLGEVGPTARASNVRREIRIEAPYAAYPAFPVNIVLETAGDLEARFVVRLKELIESCRLIRLVLADLPGGPLTVARMPRKIPAGETISRVEAPRGELFYFIKSNGTDLPERIKIRTPTLCNLASVVVLAPGHHLADIPVLLVGVDPCFSCNDRAVVLRRPDGGHDHWTWEQLRQYGIDHYRKR
jgi:NADH-quinone oxidoreductase subunit D